MGMGESSRSQRGFGSVFFEYNSLFGGSKLESRRHGVSEPMRAVQGQFNTRHLCLSQLKLTLIHVLDIVAIFTHMLHSFPPPSFPLPPSPEIKHLFTSFIKNLKENIKNNSKRARERERERAIKWSKLSNRWFVTTLTYYCSQLRFCGCGDDRDTIMI